FHVALQDGKTQQSVKGLGGPGKRLAFKERQGRRRVQTPGSRTQLADQFTGNREPKRDFLTVLRELRNLCATFHQQECFVPGAIDDEHQIPARETSQTKGCAKIAQFTKDGKEIALRLAVPGELVRELG